MHSSPIKKVLYFFPLNPADNNTGSSRRALGLLQYFKDRNISVDFVSKHDWGKWTPQTRAAFVQQQLADNLYVFRRKPVKENLIGYFFHYKLWHNLYERKLKKLKNSFPNHTTLFLQQQFNELFRNNQYDVVIISYAYWADLVYDNHLLENTITIIDTHDFLTAQHQYDNKIFDAGISFGDEIKRLGYFDKVWAIAPEEQFLFAQFLGNKVHYIPAWVKAASTTTVLKTYDLIYVATDNPHNLRGSKWFFENVYPILPTTIHIIVIGTIVDFISDEYPNVEKIKYTEDLDLYYAKSKIAICPMLTGTGLKIKVIEAMSAGLPIVCNERGLDGLPQKTNNGCFVTEMPGQFAFHIEELLKDNTLYDMASLQARACYESNFTKEVVYQKIDEAIAKALLHKF